MAGRNRNTFLKRQKEIDRVRKAGEKMARRHSKRARQAGLGAAEPSPPTESAGAILADGVGARDHMGSI